VKTMSIKGLKAVGFTLALALSLPLNAAQLDMWDADGWSQIGADDSADNVWKVDPGFGGQAFDAEYLFYKFDEQEKVLSIGLQAGFDLVDGMQTFRGKDYYAGDLALSFNSQGYNYAVDFGLMTKDYNDQNVGLGSGNQDTAGLYQVSDWNNEIYYAESSPFAMDEGSFLSAIGNEAGSEDDSFYRVVTFDLDALGFYVGHFDAHWTMSCGNDVVEGGATVPEPSPALLLLGGLLALIGSRKMRTSA
jgi:hypothetical protein